MQEFGKYGLIKEKLIELEVIGENEITENY